ncbi:hypothetical protein FZEAL_8458 [Fusarium zealandicum]|uniref:Vps72/YL1 C-terminal domain-containing protein n=1 Tax=Fusarium zealandicum TaxID=1053134 RepID=A0A8H4UEF9_9HYPO|nr:hypothetical protein FZEAL_8458 [Fusarium zealandicum]
MAAPTEAQIAHLELIEKLDIHSIHKNFRSPTWKPNQRRNKNLKAIMGDASRREASALGTPQDMSGNATPADDGLSTSGTTTPATESGNQPPNLAQASRSLSKLVLEKSLNKPAGVAASAPTATYTNIESAPSLAHNKHYCDITGLPAPYLDPKTRLRYHNREIFGLIRTLPQGAAEQFLEARGAHTVLKSTDYRERMEEGRISVARAKNATGRRGRDRWDACEASASVMLIGSAIGLVSPQIVQKACAPGKRGEGARADNHVYLNNYNESRKKRSIVQSHSTLLHQFLSSQPDPTCAVILDSSISSPKHLLFRYSLGRKAASNRQDVDVVVGYPEYKLESSSALAVGGFFLIGGVMMFFDRAMLAMGNILFLIGLTIIIGPQKTLLFFARKQKAKGTAAFFLGLILILMRWTFIGFLIEAYGIVILFGDFLGTIAGFARGLPVVGPYIGMLVDRAGLGRRNAELPV